MWFRIVETLIGTFRRIAHERGDTGSAADCRQVLVENLVRLWRVRRLRYDVVRLVWRNAIRLGVSFGRA